MRSSIVLFTILLIIGSCKSDSVTIEQGASEEEKLFFQDYESPDFQWGFLNQSGELVIEDIYDATRDFSEGLAAVNYKGKWGYINKNGKVIIPFKYRSAGAFSCKRAIVQDFEYHQFYIDQEGNVTWSQEMTELSPYQDCIARIKEIGSYFFIDTEGKLIGDTSYPSATNFNNGYAIIEDMTGYNIIGKDGILVLKRSYDKCYFPSGSMVRVKDKNQIKFISLTNGRISDAYTNATDYHDGVAAIETGSWKLINMNGEIISKGYDLISYAEEERWIFYRNGKCGILSNDGKEITPAIYDIIYRFNGGVTAYSKGDFWGVLNIDGQEITPAVFPLMWEFKNGMARAIYNGGVGFINGNGEQVVPPSFIEVRDYSEGLARVQVIN